MTTATSVVAPGGAHLVGSVPLQTAREVFTRTSQELPGRLQYLPDGETGVRGYFIVWQKSVFPLGILQERAGGPVPDELPNGSPDELFPYTLGDFKHTGYDDAALQSYKTFKELKESGAISAEARFQVSLPSPLTATRMFVKTRHCQNAEVLYKQRVLEALTNIQAQIPASELAIQWDVVMEVCLLEYVSGRLKGSFFQPYFGQTNSQETESVTAFSSAAVQQGIVDRLASLAAAVHQEAAMGFHICYGDVRRAHFVEPQDLGLLVRLSNDIVRQVAGAHSVSYVQMPVPKSRDDDDYFQALANLNFNEGTSNCKLYLGAVHANDLDGTVRRIKAARQFLPQAQLKVFGITTECGLGRIPVEDVDSILRILRELTAPSVATEKFR